MQNLGRGALSSWASRHLKIAGEILISVRRNEKAYTGCRSQTPKQLATVLGALTGQIFYFAAQEFQLPATPLFAPLLFMCTTVRVLMFGRRERTLRSFGNFITEKRPTKD